MIKIDFSPETIEQLYHNFIYAKHSKTRQKCFVLYLKSLGFSHGKILEISRITFPTLASYLKEYVDGGMESFETIRWKGAKNELLQYKQQIEKEFDADPPKSTNEARERIEKLTGISRSPTQIRTFLHKLDYKYLKVGSVPGNGKEDDMSKEAEREEFKKKSWNRVWMKQKKMNE